VASEDQERAVSTVQFQSVTSAIVSVTAGPVGTPGNQRASEGTGRNQTILIMRGRSSAGYRVGKFGRGGTDDELEKPLNPV
jgi:hypothetical protein